MRDAAEDAGLTFIDALDWLEGQDDAIGSDGVHPTDVGHQIIAQHMAAVLSPLVSD